MKPKSFNFGVLALLTKLKNGLKWPKKEGEESRLEEARRAADQGDAAAQTTLGRMYAEGLDVGQDDGEAVRWYRLAADQGYAAAQTTLLGGCMLKGEVWDRMMEKQCVGIVSLLIRIMLLRRLVLGGCMLKGEV